jgi:general stress protein YciG
MSRNDEHKGTSNRGFASMDQAKQRAIASKGGQSVPPEKRSFSQDPRLAAQAGRKGGESVPPEGRSFSQNRELAAEAGRKGGQARGASAQRRAAAANIGSDEAENSEMVTEGTGKTAIPREPMSSKPARQMAPSDQGIESDEESFGQDEMDSGNSDVKRGDLGKTPGLRSQGSGKEHPHGVR